jgi:hypothetical protein
MTGHCQCFETAPVFALCPYVLFPGETMKKTLTISLSAVALGVAALSVVTSPALAQGRVNCNWDPVCQAKRDGISVKEAKQRSSRELSCMRKAGFAPAQWRARTVDSVRAGIYRACVADGQ